jgi:hypothetical protein
MMINSKMDLRKGILKKKVEIDQRVLILHLKISLPKKLYHLIQTHNMVD